MKKLTGDQIYKMAVEKVNNNGMVYDFGSEKKQEDIQKIVDEYNKTNTMTKIPPGEYSEENGKLKVSRNGETVLLAEKDAAHNPVATINCHIEGRPQLDIRERSAEDFLPTWYINRILKENGYGEGSSSFEKAKNLIKDFYNKMHTYRSQPIAPVSEEEIERMARNELRVHDEYMYGEDWEKVEWFIKGYKAALSRTQSGYTMEQMEPVKELIWKAISCNEAGQCDYANTFLQESLNALIPSFTSVTIGDNNNIIDFKYK